MDVVTKPERSNIISITRMKKLWKVKAAFYLDVETVGSGGFLDDSWLTAHSLRNLAISLSIIVGASLSAGSIYGQALRQQNHGSLLP